MEYFQDLAFETCLEMGCWNNKIKVISGIVNMNTELVFFPGMVQMW